MSRSTIRHREFREYSVAFAFGLITLALVLSFSMLPKQGSKVAVVVLPWTQAGEIIDVVARADGSIVRQGKWRWILVAQSDATDFVDRLYAAGALAVLDPLAFSACIRI